MQTQLIGSIVSSSLQVVADRAAAVTVESRDVGKEGKGKEEDGREGEEREEE